MKNAPNALRRWLIPVLLALPLTACAAQDGTGKPAPENGDELVACTEPRPQICTMEYDPVCARVDGEWKTYASGCSACADPAVDAYRPGGECE